MVATKKPPKDVLIRLYTEEGLTDRQIAMRFGVDTSTVYRWRIKYDIQIKVEQTFKARLKGE